MSKQKRSQNRFVFISYQYIWAHFFLFCKTEIQFWNIFIKLSRCVFVYICMYKTKKKQNQYSRSSKIATPIKATFYQCHSYSNSLNRHNRQLSRNKSNGRWDFRPISSPFFFFLFFVLFFFFPSFSDSIFIFRFIHFLVMFIDYT